MTLGEIEKLIRKTVANQDRLTILLGICDWLADLEGELPWKLRGEEITLRVDHTSLVFRRIIRTELIKDVSGETLSRQQPDILSTISWRLGDRRPARIDPISVSNLDEALGL
jgi:hypothetical protein